MSAKLLSQGSGMPQMSAAFSGWQKKITMERRVQGITNGFVCNVDTPFSFMGIVQPLSPRLIAVKPEGQRSFTWLQVHCFSGPQNLTDNDRIVYQCRVYKVMGVLDYSNNGYIEYHLVEDFQP